MDNQRKKGSDYEQKAARFLEQNGYRILQTNYRCRLGEIDVIAVDGKYLVYVEVKYRKNQEYGLPVEAVDYKKQRIISKVAQHYVMSHHLMDRPMRFDVVSILGEQIEIYKNAFEFIG